MNIIITADDFGRSLERNEAIDAAFRHGLIKSAGLMVSTPYTQDAVNKAFRGGYLNKLHCHFNLVGESVGGFQIPLTKKILDDPFFCDGKTFLGYNGLKLLSVLGLKRLIFFKPIYDELSAQYNEFIRLTNGKGNCKHVDFHLFYNLNYPVALALNFLLIKNKIRTVRFIGEHFILIKPVIILLKFFGKNPYIKTVKSCNVDYFVTKMEHFSKEKTVELYVHPDMLDNQILDNSISVFGNTKQNLDYNIDLLRKIGNFNFISWEEYL